MQQSAVNKPITAEQSVGGPRELEFIIERMIGKAYTMTLVRVVEVQPGGVGPVGFLSAVDLLQQVDGNNSGIANEPMEGIPYFRLQGGGNAVIIDPKPGDLGLAVFARRDISVTKQSKQEGPPPSLRSHDVSDGIYIGGILNGMPTQFLHFLDGGIHLQSTGVFTVDATLMQVNCSVKSTGEVDDKTGSMQLMREQYNSHIGHMPSGGSTPNVPMEPAE